MDNKDFAREEQFFAGTIKKVNLLREIKPNPNWVIFCRSNLSMRLQMDYKKELLSQDIFALNGLFTFLRLNKAKYSLGALYASVIVLAVFLAGGGLTAWAAMKSMPGSPLYGVKIALEKARLLVVSQESKDKLQSEMASRRLEELKIVLDSPGSLQDKKGKVEEVVGQIQQQLISDKNQLPLTDSKDSSDKSLATAKAVVNRAEQVKKALVEAKDNLAESEKTNLSEKLAEVTDVADKTSLQALETIINKKDKTEADNTDILARFEEIIKEKELAVNNLTIGNTNNQATSTADKFPINAVLVNQSDQAKELISKIKESLTGDNFTAALDTLRALSEIVKGAERIVENSNIQDKPVFEPAADAQNGSSSVQSGF